MPHFLPARASRALAATALVAIAVGLTGCVSDYPTTLVANPAPAATSAPALPTTTPASKLAPIPRNKVAAIVAGTPITGAQYADAVQQNRIAAAYQAQQQGSVPPSEQQLRSGVLNSLIDMAVRALYAHKHGLTVTTAEVQRQYDIVQARFGGPTGFPTTLKNYGFTPASFKKQLAQNLLADKVDRKIAPVPTVEAVDARHILVKKLDVANRLYAQLRHNPRLFATLAQRFSIDTGSGASGGELGFFPRHMMVPSFEQVAFSLKVGAISKPVKSQFGYHIIQVEAHKMIPITQLSQQIQQQLFAQQLQLRQTRLSQWLHAERLRDHVRILAPGVTSA